ncbi:Ras family GTP-binding protein rho1p [Grosmannia clavigera kw1407]|uniref:Ras family GTP-binding protein rho1p n=1 Tax=Grosmannia clavigera (strain kw1407 / UAMH 11150) TaxID=655863 RepID=F0X6Z3_GROCL|nr:Ras family GTP-binding protein rho1p [Grosmannia clavigera kw1407]EFX06331.1 Ras family GTP-binding protein rho1p [Grosmannia clavigera kw1407]
MSSSVSAMAANFPHPLRGAFTPKCPSQTHVLATSWVTPPTPQDSQASESTPPSPDTSHMLPPMTPLQSAGLLSAGGQSMAAEAALPTPEQTPPSPPHRIRSNSSSLGPRGREARMQQWLTDIPLPMSPQERYLQGLNPKTNHPLHPQPLKLPSSRQVRLVSIGEEGRHVKLDNHDKENVDHVPGWIPLESKKRHNSEELDGMLARKRTKILDPVRRFSQKVSSSLALAPAIEELVEMAAVRRHSETMSSEDAAKQSEQPYQFSQAAKPQRRKSSFRTSLSKRPGSLRASGSGALRRMMKKPAVGAHPGQAAVWHEDRPDMIVNVAFIGDGPVGKSALIRRLVHGTFPKDYVPSDIHESTFRLTVDDVRVQLNLSEAGSGHDAGQPSILALGWFSVVVLCFDVGRPSSLENLQKYRNDIAMYEENAVVVLAGLKMDARHRLPPLHMSLDDEDAVPVSVAEGEEAAAKMRCNGYFECSSLGSCEGMDALFDYVLRSGVDLQKFRDKKMARFRLEHSVDKGMAKIADGVRSLFLFQNSKE